MNDKLSTILRIPNCHVCNAKAGENHVKDCLWLSCLRASAYPRILDDNGVEWEQNLINRLQRENERFLAVLNYVAIGEDKTINALIDEYDKYQDITNKLSLAKSGYEQTDEQGRPLTYWGGLKDEPTQNLEPDGHGSYPSSCPWCNTECCLCPTQNSVPKDGYIDISEDTIFPGDSRIDLDFGDGNVGNLFLIHDTKASEIHLRMPIKRYRVQPTKTREDK